MLCLDLVKAAKRKSAVDYVQSVPEPSATDKPTTSKAAIENEKAKKAIVNPTVKKSLDVPPSKPEKRKLCSGESKRIELP